MRDEQVRRYARHIRLPDVGSLGQAALLGATARVSLRGAEPLAELTAGAYLVAGGVGTLIVANSTDAQRTELAAHGPDTKVVAAGDASAARELVLAAQPAWWPSADGDAVALAFWRGSIAATQWMTDTLSR